MMVSLVAAQVSKKWSDDGASIHYLAFSPCHKSIPSGFDKAFFLVN